MKKNFFKKLSFVLALAMIVSVVAPAASAFAATDLKLNSTKKYLHLGRVESGENDFNFNINGTKKKGWKYEWSSDKEEVAVVNESNGVTTAAGVGTAKVSVVIYDKDGEEVLDKPLVATVVVRDNIKDVKVANVPEKAVAVDEVYDFNRSFVTESGSTKKTSAITRWGVDKATAQIDDSGKFKASEAGEYKVTAYSFQSTAKFDAWKLDNAKYADYVLDTDTATITVKAGIVEAKQVDADTFTVTFDSSMKNSDLSKDTAVLYRVIGGKQTTSGAEKIKEVKLDDTGKIATVELFTTLSNDTEYNFVYAGLTGVFKSAKKAVTEIAGLVFDDFTVVTTAGAKDMLGSVKAVNKDGVVIYGGSEIASYLNFSYSGDLVKGNTVGTNAYIYNVGYSAPVTVKFNNYVYDEAAKQYKTITFEASAVATGIANAVADASSMQFELISNPDPTKTIADTWKGNLSLAAKDQGSLIRARYKTNTDPWNYSYTDNNTLFTYTSSDTSKLVVNGFYAYPVAPGGVTVIVKDANGNTVNTFDVVVQAARSIASATPDKNAVVIGNNATVGEQETFTVAIADTMGDKFVANVWGDFQNVPAGNVKPVVTLDASTSGKVLVKVDARNVATVGSYMYKLTVQYPGNDWATREVSFSVTVLDATSADALAVVNGWRVELDTNSVDLKENYDKDIAIGIYGYNKNNMRVAKMDPATDYTIEVKNSSNQVKSTGASIVPVVVGVSGSEVATYDTGSYSVTAYITGVAVTKYFANTGRTAGQYLGATTFSITNTTATTMKVDNSTVAVGKTVLQAVKDAFTFKLNGNDINEANIVAVEYTNTASLINADTQGELDTALAAGNVYISSVTYKVVDPATTNNTGAYKLYKFYPGYSFTVK